jgi:hypothetical protein
MNDESGQPPCTKKFKSNWPPHEFSIRDLLLVTMIVALALGWWVDHRRQAINKREFEYFRNGYLELDRELRLYIKGGTVDPPPNTSKP